MDLRAVFTQPPQAKADIHGSEKYPDISGRVYFYQTRSGVVVVSEVLGLPVKTGPCGKEIFAFHIHSGTQCTGNEKDPFANALMHYDTESCPHPEHAGDLPPLFGNDGYALQTVLTDRFTVREVIGRTVIIHGSFDDFQTQPSGNAGEKIACGVIVPF